MTTLLVLGLLLSPPASAGEWRALSGRLQAQAAAWGGSAPASAVPVPLGYRVIPRQGRGGAVGSIGSPVLVVTLQPLLNAMWRSSLTFQAGPVTVHISGTKSSNGDKDWFLILCAQPCRPPEFRRGKDMLRYRPFLSPVYMLDRHESAVFGEKLYKITVEGQLRNRTESRLKIEAEGGGPKGEWKVREVAEAVYRSGEPVRLRGQEFRLLYVDEVLQTEQGKFDGFSGQRTIVLMTHEKGKLIGYDFREADIPSDRIGLFMKTPAGDEKDTDKLLRVGLRLDGGLLEIYDTDARK